MSHYRVGADPELFLADKTGKKILSAIGKLGGTKEKPIQVEKMPKGFCYQEDNVLVEYNIPPAASPEQFIKNNINMMNYLKTKVKNELDCTLKIQASHVMDSDQLTDPAAHIFGCEPDFNVWTLMPNPRPVAKDKALRSAGGHIHIGLANMSRVDKVMVGRLLDVYLGLWSVTRDTDTRRRELYGQAGSIRFKPYGLEYRTLSNFWLRSDSLIDYAYKGVDSALQMHRDKCYDTIQKYGDKIQKCINTSNVALAEYYMNGDWNARI